MMNPTRPLPRGWRSHAERYFHRHVERGGPDDCWPWTGTAIKRTGHGLFSIAGRTLKAHRVAWALANDADPHPLYVLHRCDNPPCCNPRHLFTGTNKDNVDDMVAKGRHANAAKTHCSQGHELTPENIYRYGRSRLCRTCRVDRAREQYQLRTKLTRKRTRANRNTPTQP